MDQHKTNETLKLFYSYGRKILPRHTDDNLCYVNDLTRVLAADASISFASVNCRTKVFRTPTSVVIARRTKMKTISLSPASTSTHRRYIPKWPDLSCVRDFQSGSHVRLCRPRRLFQSQKGYSFVFLSDAAIEEAPL
ncbi:hypothetical protein GBA52_013991 [Prunus armeniaca]|nr:hypothetical protein GBA52_013991 [Prunus armeniaca]